MLRGFIILLMGCLAGAGLAEDPSVTKFRSPDGHFGLRLASVAEKKQRLAFDSKRDFVLGFADKFYSAFNFHSCYNSLKMSGL